MGRIFVEDWASSFGSPYLVVPDEAQGTAVFVEDTVFVEDAMFVEQGERPRTHSSIPAGGVDRPLAFVDGVRRGDASLYQEDSTTGLLARGIAGSHACGAVIAGPGERPVFAHERVSHTVIWGSGLTGTLPAQDGGWSWQVASIESDDPDAPLQELQQRMRKAEGLLAENLCHDGYLTIVDGPLSYVRSRDVPVVGFVKTHTRPLLALEHHLRVPELTAGQRTGLFAIGEDRYSCYLRLAQPNTFAGPWSGIVRLEVPQSVGLAATVDVVDALRVSLPRFAGIAHRDPRAPQNMQPVGALERHLRHLMGDAQLARRAVRQAVASGGAAPMVR
jgi:hypothetical protein